MSIRTCKICRNKYEDTISNWHNKYCCRNCYENKVSKFKEGDIVYTYDNKKVNNIYYEAIPSNGEIVKIYELHHVSTNGLFQYKVEINDKIISRFEHQMFRTENELNKYIEIINKKREIDRSARELIKEIRN